MISMDVFTADAFSAVSLTAAVDKMGYVPGFLDSIPGLYVPVPIRTTDVWIEERANGPALIKTTPRGAPPIERGGDKRKGRSFQTTRVAEKSRIEASELQNIRSFGSEVDLKSLQVEIGRRMMLMKQDAALTKENMLLGMVQGVVYDADGSIIDDWFDNFKQVRSAEVPFAFGALQADGYVIRQCNTIRRQMSRGLAGVGGGAPAVHALCGDAFWDAFVTTKEVRETYRFAMQAMQLQNNVGSVWETFRYGNIIWHNYRGTDDNLTVAVASDKAKFFPVGAGIFQKAMAPGEKFEFVNTLGQDTYSWIVRDPLRDAWADVEEMSYPLYVCTMPQALALGGLAAAPVVQQ